MIKPNVSYLKLVGAGWGCYLLLPIATLAATHDPAYSGRVLLDQSQGVYFEQFASNAFALQLLQARNKFDPQTLVLGGSAEMDLQHWQGDQIATTPPLHYANGSGLYLTQAAIDAMAAITPWGTGFLSAAMMQIGQGGQNGNYYYLPHAFMVVGNLDRFPLYATLGINTLPFGMFAGSGVWDASLTSSYFNPQQVPQFTLSYFKESVNLNASLYRDEVNYQYHAAYAATYKNALHEMSYNVGLGYLTNLKTNSTGNPGTIWVRRSNNTADNMGDVRDINATISYNILSFSAEFLSGTKKVSGNAATPAAYSVLFSVAPTLLDKVTTFGATHSVSLYFNQVPAPLPGQDAVYMAAAGLKSHWAMSVSRPMYRDNVVLGVDADKVTTYDNQQSWAYTLDLTAYL